MLEQAKELPRNGAGRAGPSQAPSRTGAVRQRETVLTGYRANLGWQRTLARVVVGIDFVAMAVPAWILIGVDAFHAHNRRPSFWLGLAMPLLWLAATHLVKAHEPRVLGVGSDEFRRIIDAAIWLVALVGFVSYALHANLSRGLVAIAFPAALLLDLAGRYAARRWLHRQHRSGRYGHRVLLVGPPSAVVELAHSLRRAAYAGMNVVGCCLTDPTADVGVLRVLGSYDRILDVVCCERITAVAVVSSDHINSLALRRLTWALERTGVQLLVSPNVTECVTPRIRIWPLAGLPLLHIEEPEFTGTRRLLKALVDRAVGLLALAVLSPLLVAIAFAVRLTSPGPVLYRQVRIGHGGKEFLLYKFRTMHVGADARRDELSAHNDCGDGLLFKIRRDPRVTTLGIPLRRYSLDELPQLLNVLRGNMSLVGPRPPLPSEVARYGNDVRRRLLVPPGITGLWQVSGRSDLSWEESVRLDLYYVENWSLSLDLMILCKTIPAVFKGGGAY